MSKFELKDVRVTDGFFSDYAELVRTEVIPYQWEALNDRIPGGWNSGVDEHVLPVAAQKLRVALADVNVVDIQAVHRHRYGRLILRCALKYQHRCCDNYEN